MTSSSEPTHAHHRMTSIIPIASCSMPKACTEKGREEDVYSVARGWRSIQRQALLTNLRTLIGETTLSPQTKAKQNQAQPPDRKSDDTSKANIRELPAVGTG